MPTVAAAYKAPTGEVYVATDTQVTESSSRKLYLLHPKMIVTDHLAMTYAGPLRAKDVLEDVAGKIEVAKDGQVDTREVADLTYKVVEKRKLLILDPTDKEGVVVRCFFESLMCTYRHIYVLFDDFSVIEIYDNFWAIGSGSSYALGAWYALQQEGMDLELPPLQILRCTLGAATKYDSFCSGDFGGVIVGETVSEYTAL